MPYINDEAFDGGLDYLDTNGTRVDITSQEAATYGQATTGGTYSLGNKTGLNTGAPGNASAGSGRSVVVPAITDGSVTNSGTASHWALTDGTSLLLATNALSATQAVTATNTFTLDSIEIFIRDATSL